MSPTTWGTYLLLALVIAAGTIVAWALEHYSRSNGVHATHAKMLAAKRGPAPTYEDFSVCSPPPAPPGLYEAREEFYRQEYLDDDQELAAADSIKLTPELEAWAESSKHR